MTDAATEFDGNDEGCCMEENVSELSCWVAMDVLSSYPLLVILHRVVLIRLLVTPLVDDAKDNGLAAETVCESDIGDSALEAAVEVEPVSEVNGEYFVCKTEWFLVSIVLTRFAFDEHVGIVVPTTFAVLITTGICLAETDIPFTSRFPV